MKRKRAKKDPKWLKFREARRLARNLLNCAIQEAVKDHMKTLRDLQPKSFHRSFAEIDCYFAGIKAEEIAYRLCEDYRQNLAIHYPRGMRVDIRSNIEDSLSRKEGGENWERGITRLRF